MIVGLTGGIGSGKSTVARLLRIMGYPVYDSDQRARHLQEQDEELIAVMVALLGADILEAGGLNRGLIAQKVFGDPELLNQLNKIVHPRVKADFERWVQEQTTPIVFKESALLVETGAYRDCAALVLVQSPERLRIERVMKRDRVTIDEVRARMNRQASEETLQKAADYTIDNDEQQLLIPQVEKLVQALKISR